MGVRSLGVAAAVLTGALALMILGVLLLSLWSVPRYLAAADSAVDVHVALAFARGDWQFHGPPSYSEGTFHPGPLLYVVMTLGVVLFGASQATLGASVAVVALMFAAVAVTAAALSFRAGLATGLAFLLGLLWLYRGGFGLHVYPLPGVIWTPAVAAAFMYCLGPAWALASRGRWALPLVAALACAGIQLYLPTAPASAVVLASVAWYCVRLRRSKAQRPFIAGTVLVVAVGFAFVPFRVAEEGLVGFLGSFSGSGGPAPFSYAGDAVLALWALFRPYEWLVFVPVVGLLVGLLVVRCASPSTLVRTTGRVVVSSALLCMLLAGSLVVAMNRSTVESAAWPVQMSVLAHIACLVALLLSLVVWAVLRWARRISGSASSSLSVGVSASVTSAGIVLMVLLLAVLLPGRPTQLQPWGSRNGVPEASRLADLLVDEVEADGVTLFAVLGRPIGLFSVPEGDDFAFLVSPALVMFDQAGTVCWFGGPAGMAPSVGECRPSDVTRVVTVVDPGFEDVESVPGRVLAMTDSKRGPIVVMESSPAEVRRWVESLSSGSREFFTVSPAYCGLGFCAGSGMQGKVDVPAPVQEPSGSAGQEGSCSADFSMSLDIRESAAAGSPQVVRVPAGSSLKVEVLSDRSARLVALGSPMEFSVPSGSSAVCLDVPEGVYTLTVEGEVVATVESAR